MKRIYLDLTFIVLLAAFLLILDETNNMELITYMPFISLYIPYAIGRYVGQLSLKKKQENTEMDLKLTE